MEAFECFVIKRISSIFGSRLLIFKCKICSSFIFKIFNLELPVALQQPQLFHLEGMVGSMSLQNGRMFKGILLLFTLVESGFRFMSSYSNKINLENESYLCSRIFARAKQESWHLKNLFRVISCISKKFIEKKLVFDIVMRHTRFFCTLYFVK